MTKLNKFFKLVSATATVLAVSPMSVLGQALGDNEINLKGLGGSSNFSGITNFKPGNLISTGINLLLIGAALLSFIFLLVGGVQWILAGGDKEGTDKARKKITNALIGLAIVFSAYAIAFIIQALFGINIFQFTLKKIGEY